MALKPKTAVLQVRIDPELLKTFQASCDLLEKVPSVVVRELVRLQVEDWKRRGLLGGLEGGKVESVEVAGKTAPRGVKAVPRGAH